MKIKKIVFNNFRNYKGNHIFELNKQITILYGENGNGKSSFFDGIEWCLTGFITRFTEKKPPKGALANKDIIEGEECYVEFYFSDFCIKRTFSKQRNNFSNIDFCLLSNIESNGYEKIAVGEDRVDNKLRELFEQEGIEYKDNKYKVGEMINKAYILSQDQVADFVSRDKPGDRFNALASIMGFEKVVKIRKNLNLSKNLLKEKYLDIEREKLELIKSLEILNEKLKPVNNRAIKDYMDKTNSSFKNKNEINDDINKRYIAISSLENEIQNINLLRVKEFEKLEDFEEIIKLHNSKVLSLEKGLKELVIKEDKIKSEIVRIKTLKEKNTEVSKENNLYNDLTKEIDQLNIEINDIIRTMNLDDNKYEIDFERKSKDIEKELSILKFTIEKKKEYDYSKSSLTNFDIAINEGKILLDEKKNTLNALIIQENNIKNKILKNNEVSSLNILIESIQDIQNYMKHNDTKGHCPVCLSNVGDNLEKNILHNFNHLLKVTAKNKEVLEQEIKEKDILEMKRFKAKKDIEELEDSINRLEVNKLKAIEIIEKTETNFLFGNYFSFDMSLLKEKEQILIINLKRCNSVLNKLNKIQTIKHKVLTVTKKPYISNAEISNLESKLAKLNLDFTAVEQDIKKQEKLLLDKNSRIFNLNKSKNEYSNIIEKYKFISIKEIVDSLKEELAKEKEVLALHIESLTNFENEEYNSEIEKDKVQLKNRISKLQKSLEYTYDKQLNIENVISNLDEEYGGEATDFLNNNNSVIQSYYRYLNPSPGEFNNLYFDIQDNENLYIKIKQSNKNQGIEESYYTDANMILSSGQLNVLALSIFIATNGAQVCSYFDFIAIDDPIQNMDDINRFSVTDILSNLERQLIFSTHDQEFLNLFLKKNELRKNDINIFSLDANENIYKSLIINQ